jgi:hypothetical protein
MNVATFEGFVEQGKIQLKTAIHLPDNTRVYVLIPDFRIEQRIQVLTPRLLHPEQAEDFEMEIIEGTSDLERATLILSMQIM